MSRSVWYKKRDDLLYLLDKRNDGESFTDREDDRFEKYLDKTSLVTYHTHDKESLTDEYIQMCKIKTNRYEIQKTREEMDEYKRQDEKARQLAKAVKDAPNQGMKQIWTDKWYTLVKEYAKEYKVCRYQNLIHTMNI